MERLSAALPDLRDALNPYLARIESELVRLETLAGLDWRLLLGGGLVAASLLWLLLRRRGGRKATPEALEASFERLVAAGVDGLDQPYRLLTARWKHLPAAFVQEIVGRLRDKASVIDFVVLAERLGLERGRLAKIAKAHGPESAVQVVAALLVGLSGKRPSEAETALSLAMRLDPQDPVAVLTLAAGHYGAKRYKVALPLLELGISLSRNAVEAPAPATVPQKKLRGLLRRSMEMYEACLERVDPSLA